jgi:hypothetical protein
MMNNFLITQGSCGTYALKYCMGEYFNYGYKIPWNTHSNNPNTPPKDSRVVYLFANPYDTILSYFRRDKVEFNCNGGFLFPHTTNIGGDVDYFKNPENRIIENFLKDEYDPFFLREHYDKWATYNERNYDLVMMRYEELSENGVSSFIDYWDLPKNLEFKFRKRSSDWQNEPQEIQDRLKQKYGEYFDAYHSLPLVSIG